MTPDLPQVESAIIEMTNAFRAQNGLGAVRSDLKLRTAAQRYGRYLIATDAFSHTADGKGPAQRAEAAGYAYCQVAENLALNIDSRGFAPRDLARQVVEGWKNSPGHRRNLLAPLVTDIGVALAKADGRQKYISVQLFGRPRALRFSFRIRNAAAQAVEYVLDGETQRLAPNVQITHTVCKPQTFRLNREGARSFEVTRDDLFVVKPGGRGGLTVEHRPAVR